MKRLVAGLMLAAVLGSGCAIFTKPTNTITVERQDFINAWARAKVIYGKAFRLASRACAQGAWPEDECRKAAALHEQAKRVALEIEAKIATPESELDWKVILKVLEFAADIVL